MTSAFDPQEVPMMTSASNVGVGWHPIIRELEEALNAIDPEYEIQQVKEKFGGLRYYAQTTNQQRWNDFHAAIGEAEEKSTHFCEECGQPAETKSYYGWLKTLCTEHAAERDRNHAKTMREMHQEHGGEG